MAVRLQSELNLRPVPFQVAPVDPTPDPTLGEITGAAARLFNPAFSFADSIGKNTFSTADERELARTSEFREDMLEKLLGTQYEPFITAFDDDFTEEQVAQTKARVDGELYDRDVISRGGATAVLTSLALGILDPINLLPIGAAAKVARGAKATSMLKGALTTARAGFLGAAASEAALMATRDTHTFGEAALDITAATFLSSLLGGAAGALSKGEMQRLSKMVENDLDTALLADGTPVIPDVTPPAGATAFQRAGFAEPPERIVLHRIVNKNGEDVVEFPAKVLEKDTPQGQHITDPAAVDPAMARFIDDAPEGAVQDFVMKGSAGAAYVAKLARLSPVVTLGQSPALATRKALAHLVDVPFIYAQNALGLVSPISVETLIKRWNANLGVSVREMGDTFGTFRKRGGKLNRKQFYEQVSFAMRRGDEHIIPEVQALARTLRKTVFEPLKEAAIREGLLPEDVTVETAISYLTRVYNRQKINELPGQFDERVIQWLSTAGIEDVDARDFAAIAQHIRGQVTGAPTGRTHFDLKFNVGKAGVTKERTFTIPDSLIEDFLENDIEVLTRYYVRTLAPDVEIKARFGSLNMKSAINEIDAEYQRLIEAQGGKDPGGKLTQLRERDIKRLVAMRDQLRHQFGHPDDPAGFFARAGRSLRELNYITRLGGMTISAIPDLFRTTMLHGLTRTMQDGIIPLVTNLRVIKMAGEEARLAGTAWDMVLDTRAMSLADIGDEFGTRTLIERGLTAGARSFSTVSLMAPWNSAMKQFAGTVVQARILRAVIEGGDVQKLASVGISKEMRGRIAQQFAQHGTSENGVRMARTLGWDDIEAQAVFRAAVQKDVDIAIVTPGVGDRPLWMSKEVGKTIGQFKSFGFAATNRMLILGLQQADMATLNGTVLSVTAGMMVYKLKTELAGRETSEDWRKWVLEGVDRSGITGIFFDINNIADRTFGVSANRIVGIEGASRFASRNKTGTLLGPVAGQIEDITAVGAKAFGVPLAFLGEEEENITTGDLRRLRRITPYNNLFYLQSLLTAWERKLGEKLELQDSIGIRRRNRRRRRAGP